MHMMYLIIIYHAFLLGYIFILLNRGNIKWLFTQNHKYTLSTNGKHNHSKTSCNILLIFCTSIDII